jgi:hypothetical protein
MPFSWPERVLLLALICLSLLFFWRRFRKVLRNIREARPEPGYVVRPLAPRIRKFVWEVLLQGLVIRQRPLPGLAHALVFWGFLVFALVTANHMAEAFGLGFGTASAAPISQSRPFSLRPWRLRLRGSRSAASWCGRAGWGRCLPSPA